MSLNQKKSKYLAKIKINALKLRTNYQLPMYLVVLIQKLDHNSSDNEVKYLMQLSEHYLRIKNYYLKYRQLDNQYSDEIKKDYQSKFGNKLGQS